MSVYIERGDSNTRTLKPRTYILKFQIRRFYAYVVPKATTKWPTVALFNRVIFAYPFTDQLQYYYCVYVNYHSTLWFGLFAVRYIFTVIFSFTILLLEIDF